MMGQDTYVRMPLTDVDRTRALLADCGITTADGSGVMRSLRLIKSDSEVSRLRHSCHIASAAFALLPSRLHAIRGTKQQMSGAPSAQVSVREARDAFRMMLVDFGADDVDYVMAQAVPSSHACVCAAIWLRPTCRLTDCRRVRRV
jgi:Xaa-Pro dipeptidase